MNLFGRTFRYEELPDRAIQEAKKNWSRIEEIINAIEWTLLHDPHIGKLINERGIRAFTYPGARSIKEPDIDVMYEEESDYLIVIHDLTFRDAKAHYAGHA